MPSERSPEPLRAQRKVALRPCDRPPKLSIGARISFTPQALISEYKDTKPPLPPPLNLLSFAYYGVAGTIRYLSQLSKGETKEVRPSTIGFKKVPPNLELRSFERREQAALKECLRQRSRRHEESNEGKTERLEQTLSKLEEQNRTRFDNVNGRLDNIMRVLDFQRT